MTGYELYVFFVCLVMFVSLLSLLGTMLFIIIRQELRMIDNGLLDKKIAKEYMKSLNKEPFFKTTFGIVTIAVTAVVFACFAWTFSVRFSDPMVKGAMSVPRVVLSSSMSTKRNTNTYLEKYGLNEQFDTFDMIFTNELPGEFELELYDVVVYENERGELIIHRIVSIEEPNEKHPDHRLFELRGDAVKYSDEELVEYSQMRSIYRGEKIPYVGSFVYFVQSPSGYLCILLVFIGFFITPLIEKYLWRRKLRRLEFIGFIVDD